MFYEDLRRYIARSMEESVILDSIPFDPSIVPYVNRVKNGEPAGRVIRDFMRTIDSKRTWTLRHNLKSYHVIMNSKFTGHVSAPYKGRTINDDPDLVTVVTRILQCLAGLDGLLRNGNPTHLIPDDGHEGKNGEQKHPGYKWVYIEDECEGEVKGKVMVHIALPPDEAVNRPKFPESNRVYHVLPEGAENFANRQKDFDKYRAAKGEVTVTLND